MRSARIASAGDDDVPARYDGRARVSSNPFGVWCVFEEFAANDHVWRSRRAPCGSVAYDIDSGESKVLAGSYQGKRFNAPNDLVIDSSGGIYFTDPLFRAPQPLPQGVQAVYYIRANGEVSRVTEDLAAPNGIGLSPDGKRLYVAPSRQAEMLVYQVNGPGKLSDGETFCRLKQPAGKDKTADDLAP